MFSYQKNTQILYGKFTKVTNVAMGKNGQQSTIKKEKLLDLTVIVDIHIAKKNQCYLVPPKISIKT